MISYKKTRTNLGLSTMLILVILLSSGVVHAIDFTVCAQGGDGGFSKFIAYFTDLKGPHPLPEFPGAVNVIINLDLIFLDGNKLNAEGAAVLLPVTEIFGFNVAAPDLDGSRLRFSHDNTEIDTDPGAFGLFFFKLPETADGVLFLNGFQFNDPRGDERVTLNGGQEFFVVPCSGN